MTDVRHLHDTAMEWADKALAAKAGGEQERAHELFERAYEFERQAAESVATTSEEPSRSILHRSAAALALECGKLRDAERLISQALAGNPPEEVCEELRNLLEQVQFH